jgi:hypothetical protein
LLIFMMRPESRSVTSALPSGRNATPQGTRSPLTSTSVLVTRGGPDGRLELPEGGGGWLPTVLGWVPWAQDTRLSTVKRATILVMIMTSPDPRSRFRLAQAWSPA